MPRDPEFYSSALVGIAVMRLLSSKNPTTVTMSFPSEQSATAVFARLRSLLLVEHTGSPMSISVSGVDLTAKNAAASDAEREDDR